MSEEHLTSHLLSLMNFDSKKILQRMDKVEYEKKKVDEMFNTKHRLFEFLHFRLKTLVNLETSQKLGWYKRRWGLDIKQFYNPKDSRVIGDLDRIIGELNMEFERVKSLTNKQFRKKFS